LSESLSEYEVAFGLCGPFIDRSPKKHPVPATLECRQPCQLLDTATGPCQVDNAPPILWRLFDGQAGPEDGVFAEVTVDYYAQDKAGNVWYFGEQESDYDESGTLIIAINNWAAVLRRCIRASSVRLTRLSALLPGRSSR
jgi:hypothetical protein